MARVTAALYDERELPIEIQTEHFSFGQVVYFTIGGFSAPDTVTFLLNPSQLSIIAAAVQAHIAQRERIVQGGDSGEVA